MRAEEETGPTCPPNLRVWRSHGDAEPGGQWEAKILDIDGDIGILREVLIRFGDGTLPRGEAQCCGPNAWARAAPGGNRSLLALGSEAGRPLARTHRPAGAPQHRPTGAP